MISMDDIYDELDKMTAKETEFDLKYIPTDEEIDRIIEKVKDNSVPALQKKYFAFALYMIEYKDNKNVSNEEKDRVNKLKKKLLTALDELQNLEDLKI